MSTTLWTHYFYFIIILQHCKIYLCGTKSDLIEADRSVRQVDYHDVQDFADGKHVFICFCFLCATITKHFNKTTLTFTEIGAQHFETSSKTGKNVGK